MNLPVCDSPRIIPNPLLPELLSRYGNFYIRGKEYGFYRKAVYFERYPSFLSPRLRHIKHDDLDSCFILDKSTGETFPLYLEVPCGHCDNCRATKVYSFVHRCKLESMSYNCQPIFLTLTYENKFLPKNGVNLRDVQLFLKRLRINLQRNGYSAKIRYVCVSEYGKHGRPHYHAILWNLHQTDILSFKQIGEIIKESWSNGFIMLRLIDLSNDKAFFYTSKYLRKGSNVPEGQNPTFMVSSNRNGGIGSAFIDTLAKHIRRTLDVDAKFLNKFSGKIESLQFNRYVLNRIFPSISISLTSQVKSAVKRFVLNYRTLSYFSPSSLEHSISLDVRDVLDNYSPLFYIYDPHCNIPTLNYRSPNDLLREMIADEALIVRSLLHKDEFKKYFELNQKRARFLGKMFLRSSPVDLSTRSIKFLRLEAVTQANLIL